MLAPKPMKKLVVFGPKVFMKEVVETLYDLEVVHINDYSKKETSVFELGNPFEENEELSGLLVKTRSLIDTFEIKNSDSKTNYTLNEVKEKITKIHLETYKLFDQKKYFSKILELIDSKTPINTKDTIKPYEKEKFESHNHFIGFVRDPTNLKECFQEISPKIEVKKGTFENLNLFAIFSPTKDSKKVQKLLESADFVSLPEPQISSNYPYLKSKSFIKFQSLKIEIKKIKTLLIEIETSIEKIKKQYSQFIIDAKKILKSNVDKAEAPLRFGTTKNTFLLKGWVPAINSDKVESKLNSISNTIHVELTNPDKNDNVPISFDNPKIVKPFESFMELYTLPSYKEIDPTFFMFLTFPIFFGFMLGDVGYGLITLILFSFLKKKMPSMKNMLNAFIIASIATIVFGMVFGEYFGLEELPHGIAEKLGMQAFKDVHTGEILYPIPHLFSRSHGITDLLSLSVLIGIVHILIGLIIGFINVKNQHGLKHAITEKAGWILMMPLIIWLLIDFLSVITGPIADMIKLFLPILPILLILFVIGAILTIIGEGIIGLIEILFFSIMSNILSYARLMAVGLASLSLAVVVNEMAGEMITQGIGGIIAAILVLVLGHTINIALGILSPFLHSLRLHYVEFFGKFYKGGGKEFGAFGSDSKI